MPFVLMHSVEHFQNQFIVASKMLHSYGGVPQKLMLAAIELNYIGMWLSLRVHCTSIYAIDCPGFRRWYFRRGQWPFFRKRSTSTQLESIHEYTLTLIKSSELL